MTPRAQFVMWLCGLIPTLSMVLAHENVDYDTFGICAEDSTAVLQTMDNESGFNLSLSKINCFIYNLNVLSCSWNAESLPENAQHSTFFQFDSVSERHPFNCVSDISKKMVECHAKRSWFEVDENMFEIYVLVNISLNGHWSVICQYYELINIEKLDPPEITATLSKSPNLEIQWLQTKSCCSKPNKCFVYELKINNETVELIDVLSYNLTSIEPTLSYTVQIRSKHRRSCASNDVWSDWSEAVAIKPHKNTFELEAGVIVSIVLVLPMILLAFLLVCKFQRLFKKLFPPIPNPSRNIQNLLENNNFNQETPHKPSEDGAEVLEVIS